MVPGEPHPSVGASAEGCGCGLFRLILSAALRGCGCRRVWMRSVGAMLYLQHHATNSEPIHFGKLRVWYEAGLL